MSVATASSSVAAERTLADRVLAAVPLLSIFLWLSIVYAIEAWQHGTPWLFGDELELTQLSRAIADTGHAARRGEPHSFNTLWTYLMAPAWMIDFRLPRWRWEQQQRDDITIVDLEPCLELFGAS